MQIIAPICLVDTFQPPPSRPPAPTADAGTTTTTTPGMCTIRSVTISNIYYHIKKNILIFVIVAIWMTKPSYRFLWPNFQLRKFA